LRIVTSCEYRSLLQNIVFFIGLFCKGDVKIVTRCDDHLSYIPISYVHVAQFDIFDMSSWHLFHRAVSPLQVASCPRHLPVCCSVWQRVAVCWRVLECVGVCCSVLACVAVC